MIVKDYWGNPIEVTDLKAAKEQAEIFASFDTHIIFPEKKQVQGVDQWGKPITHTVPTNSGKQTTAKEYWTHFHNQLQKL